MVLAVGKASGWPLADLLDMTVTEFLAWAQAAADLAPSET